MRQIKEWFATGRAIYVLVALFVLLGGLYSVTTPIFEAGDELWHYPHVWWIAHGNGLPVQDPAQKQLWEQEGGQPPLYYVTSAALTFWINTDDLQERLWRNPYARIGVPLAFGNKNMVVHTGAENFPWSGTTLAVHLIRLLSVLFSAGTVFLTYQITREILSSAVWLALLAASFVAFNPMFLFISASVNNDSLAALMATAALYLTIQLMTRGITNLRVLFLGILIGLAILTKVSNLALLPVALLVLAYGAWRNKNIFDVLRLTIYLLLPVLILDAWWFVRNYLLYGDPTAFNIWLQIAGRRPPQTLFGLLDEFQGFRISFWGNFGGVNVIAPDWVYTALDLFTLLAAVGLIVGVIARLVLRQPEDAQLARPRASGIAPLPSLLWIPALHLAIVFAALIRWTLMTYASQGRLIFPAIAAVSILIAFGLYEMTFYVLRLTGRVLQIANRVSPIPYRRAPVIVPALLSIVLFVFAVAAPFLVIAPVYAQPARLNDETRVSNPVHIRFDDGNAQPELLGFETTRFLQPNEDLPITLYWRTTSPVTDDLKMYIHVYDIHGKLVGQWDAYPGNGLYPPHLWQPNEIIVDEYRVPVKLSDASYPPLGRIEVGMARVGGSNVLTAHSPQGETITPSLAQFKFSHPKNAPANAQAILGEQFNLLNLGLRVQRGINNILPDPNDQGATPVRAGDLINLGIVLQSRKIPDADYTLFAHLVNSKGTIVSQRDAQPLENTYPTSLWDPNEQVADILQVDVPRDALGSYTLEVGVYLASDLQRLPISGGDFEVWHVRDHLVAPIEIKP